MTIRLVLFIALLLPVSAAAPTIALEPDQQVRVTFEVGPTNGCTVYQRVRDAWTARHCYDFSGRVFTYVDGPMYGSIEAGPSDFPRIPQTNEAWRVWAVLSTGAQTNVVGMTW